MFCRQTVELWGGVRRSRRLFVDMICFLSTNLYQGIKKKKRILSITYCFKMCYFSNFRYTAFD